jgi:cell division protein DivIC
MANPLQQLSKSLPKPLRNKYFLILALFFGYMVFFDSHDFLTQFKLLRTVNKLENDKAFYTKKIEEAEQQRLDMEVNKERFARERYFMQKTNEDVFIIVQEEN